MSLDRIDTEIIRQLQLDGRRPNTDIARRLGVAEGTIRKRISRLVRERVIQIGAWADPLKLGYTTYATFELQVHLAHLEKAATALARLPEIYFLYLCTGAYDIYAAACFRSPEHLHEFLTKHLARVPGVLRASTSNITRVVKRQSVLPTPDGSASRRGGGRRRSTPPQEVP